MSEIIKRMFSDHAEWNYKLITERHMGNSKISVNYVTTYF